MKLYRHVLWLSTKYCNGLWSWLKTNIWMIIMPVPLIGFQMQLRYWSAASGPVVVVFSFSQFWVRARQLAPWGKSFDHFAYPWRMCFFLTEYLSQRTSYCWLTCIHLWSKSTLPWTGNEDSKWRGPQVHQCKLYGIRGFDLPHSVAPPEVPHNINSDWHRAACHTSACMT